MIDFQNHHNTSDSPRTLLQSALSYAERGWCVFPIWGVRKGVCRCGKPCGKNAGKHPIPKRGVYAASRDREQIEIWWTEYPDANIGLATGSKSGVFVLDVDIKAGSDGRRSLALLEEQYGTLPSSFRVDTPSGGYHLYLLMPEFRVGNSVSTLGPGLDIRGDGGYVLLPPSRLANGQYIAHEAAIRDAPEWLLDRIATTPANRSSVPLTPDGVAEGERDVAIFKFGSRLRAQGVSQEDAEILVARKAEQCDPPFPVSEAIAKVHRIYEQYGENYDLTDLGNAERLLDLYGDDFRFCKATGTLVWDGARWTEDHTNAVWAMATEVVRLMKLEAAGLANQEPEKANALKRHHRVSSRVDRIRAIKDIALRDPKVNVSAERLDANPWLLNCLNGTLDLRTGELRDHDRRDFITKMVASEYHPDADAPLWERFLERVLPDADIRAFVQRACGYSLTGSVREQVLFFLYGTGKNGKSTFLEVLQAIVRDYAKVGPPELLLISKTGRHPTEIAHLQGARFVPTIEVEEGRQLAEAQTKWLTGGDRITARRMHQDFYEFDPQFKIWLAANHKPTVKGTDDAIWRRIMLVPFTVTIPENERDTELPDKLLAEAPGILAWAVRGCLEWRRTGLRPPETVRVATTKYRTDMDVLQQFLEECTIESPGSRLDPLELFTVYERWCRSTREYVLTQRALNTRLEEKGYERGRPGHANRRPWLGLTLSEEGTMLLSGVVVTPFSRN